MGEFVHFSKGTLICIFFNSTPTWIGGLDDGRSKFDSLRSQYIKNWAHVGFPQEKALNMKRKNQEKTTNLETKFGDYLFI